MKVFGFFLSQLTITFAININDEPYYRECETIDISPLQPKIVWDNVGEHFGEGRLEKGVGTLKVPSDYHDANGVFITIDVERYRPWARERPSDYHVFILPGGPGGKADSETNVVQELHLHIPQATFYIINYRGMGRTTFFFPETLEEEHWTVDRIVENAPFPLKDLTMENAARDAAMAIVAVKNRVSSPGRFAVYGFSAGARWAHLLIAQYPDMLDVALLGGIPRFGNLPRKTHRGMLENCRKDVKCRKIFGNDPWKTYQMALNNVIDSNHNQCTRLFHSYFDYSDVSKRRRASRTRGEHLLSVLRRLNAIFLTFPKEGQDFLAFQLVPFFLKAMSDCLDFSHFENVVLSLIKQNMFGLFRHRFSRHFYHKRQKSDRLQVGYYNQVNLLINELLNANDSYNSITRWDCEQMPNDGILDTVVDPTLCSYFGRHWKLLNNYLKDAIYFEEEPIVSHRTQLYFFSSLMDVTTPPNVAWDLFNKVKVPRKVWIMFDNLNHETGYEYPGHVLLLANAIQGTMPRTKRLKQEVARVNRQTALNWTSASYPRLTELLKQIELPPPKGIIEDYLPSVLVVDTNRFLLEPSPPPVAYCTRNKDHPIYREKFAKRARRVADQDDQPPKFLSPSWIKRQAAKLYTNLKMKIYNFLED